MHSSFKRKLYLGSGASIFLLVAITILSAISLNQLLTRSSWVDHTNEVLLTLESILSGLKDAETGQRGYLLTQNPEYLEPYIGSYNKVFTEFNKVKNLTIDNENQQKRLVNLKILINHRYTHIGEVVKNQSEGNREEALSLIKEGKGKEIMDSIRILVNTMKSDEMKLRGTRYEKVKKSTIISGTILLIGSIFSLGICISYFIILKKDADKRFEAELRSKDLHKKLEESYEELLTREEQLKAINLKLEDMVEDRTKEVKKRAAELERINIDLDNFVYTASHELKAPVVNLQSLILSVKEEKNLNSDSYPLLIEMIEVSIEKLKHTVSQLEKVSQIRNYKSAEIIMVEKAVKDAMEILSDDLTQVSHHIITSIMAPELTFSYYHFITILTNILSNSIKFRSPLRPLELTISTHLSDSVFNLTIEDNGIGFEQELLQKVFGMFRKAHNVEGSGIGLYIVKRIVEEYGGQIEVSSKPEQGSTFLIKIPQ